MTINMASRRTSSNLYLLASLLSAASFAPLSQGFVIPATWKQQGREVQTDPRPDTLTADSRSDPIIKEVEIDIEVIHQDTLPPWARESRGAINQNLHAKNGRFLPTRIRKPAARKPTAEELERISRHQHTFTDPPVTLTTAPSHLLWGDDDRLPAPIDPAERPIPTTALMAGISDPDDVPDFLRDQMLEDISRLAEDQISNAASSRSSAPATASSPTSADDWLQTMDLDFPDLSIDGPPDTSSRPCAYRLRYFSQPAWFERTSVLILGILVLFLLAVGIVELGEALLKKCRRVRRQRLFRKKGQLRLDGDEKRLSAIVEVDEEE